MVGHLLLEVRHRGGLLMEVGHGGAAVAGVGARCDSCCWCWGKVYQLLLVLGHGVTAVAGGYRRQCIYRDRKYR